MSGAAGKAAAEVSKFSWTGIKKTWEVFPLFFVLGLHTVGCLGVIAYMFNTRDIQVNRRRKPINERVDLLEPWPLKLRVLEFGPQPLPDLHAIYQSMDEERARRDQDAEERRKLTKTKKSTRKN